MGDLTSFFQMSFSKAHAGANYTTLEIGIPGGGPCGTSYPGGGFKFRFFHPENRGEDFDKFDSYFFKWVETTNWLWIEL